MSYLVDTNYLLWSLVEPDRIDRKARGILRGSRGTKYASVITFWEVSLKYSLGKLDLSGITPEGILKAALESGYELLDLTGDCVASSYRLPTVADHRDPFDRLLVWQCIEADLTMLSADLRFREYTRHGLKLV